MKPAWFMQPEKKTSLLARLDFRTKVWMMFVLSVVAFIWDNPYMNGSLVILILIFAVTSGIRLQYIRFVLTVMLPFMLFILAMHGFFNTEQVKQLSGRDTLSMLFAFPAHWRVIGGFGLSLEGLMYGINVAAKMLIVTLVVPLGVFTTEIDAMVVSLVQAKIPYRFVFIFSSALRFFPLLAQEMNTIREAQKLRGLDISRLGWAERIRLYGNMAVPLILGAMVKSQKLEVVLQSKAFTGSSDRTYLHAVRLQGYDYAVIVFLGIFLLISIFLFFNFGIGKFVV